jgi:hypothetical protein
MYIEMNKNPSFKLNPLEIILGSIAAILTISIFLKAIIDIDTNYDTWWYHLPFAARIWGIVPPEKFKPELAIDYRFEGFPLLAHFLQGALWRLTGRIQATNLVGFFSLIAYFAFLRIYFKIPLYLSAIAIFTIPAVLTHATVSLVDLPGNIGVSILVMMAYIFYKQAKLPTKGELIIAFIGATIAANIKPQLQPLVFLIICFIAIRLVWLFLKQSNNLLSLFKILPIALLASLIIFATPVKNIALHGNPFYPIKIQIAGIVLPHKLTPETYKEGNRPQKWLQSLLEINTPTWSTDQWNRNDPKYLDRAGGFFGAYVIFNLLLLLGLTIKEFFTTIEPKSNDAKIALLLIVIASFFTANFPQSHELRYFMFWAICLVSLNLYLISRSQLTTEKKWRWLQPKYMGLVYLVFLLIVLIKIDRFYYRPVFSKLDRFMAWGVKTELLQQIKPNDRVCLLSRHALANPKASPYASMPNAFLYSDYFHPELNSSYSIEIRVDSENCTYPKIIPGES